jgi:hypothetical protein
MVTALPADLATELESRFFWWEPVGSQPRSLPKSDQDILRKARDRVSEIPEVVITHGSLAITATEQ